MKRILALVLACTMVFSLVACGSSKTNEDDWSLRREKVTDEELNGTPSAEQLVTIETACGKIQGIQKDGYKEFRGVRYATAERWEEAVAVTSWDGVYDATVWGDRSYQYKGLYGMEDSVVSQFYADEAVVPIEAGYSEDCLNLNIWTPDGAEDCPVLVYIHGGSFLTGSNTDISTDGEAYAHHGVITVAINYRLGPYGQVYGDGYEGNFALLDQLTALRWVRDNIADYGGDPSKITIMGESAGAISVQNLLISPLVEDGLIAGAIMLSGGGCLNELSSPTVPGTIQTAWDALKVSKGVDSIEDLKSLSAKELYSGWLQAGGSTTPIINGVSLTNDVQTALDENTVKNVPCIIGMLSQDMWPYSLYNAAVNYGVDRAEAGGEPVYLYYFDRQLPGENKFGAYHGADLYYIFGTLHRNWRPFDDTDYRIAEDMIDYVANFVKTGDPNGKGLTEWEPVTTDNAQFLNFGDAEPAMMSPNVSALAKTQNTASPFPYADRIKVNNSQDNNVKDEKTAIDPADLLGDWLITGWDTISDGSYVGVDYEATFSFNETQRFYYVEGELSNTRDYYWKDDMTIVIDMDGTEYECAVYWGRDGYMMLEDPRYGIAYTCVRAGDATTAISAESLIGVWTITGWNSLADGTFTAVQGNQTFEFDGSTVGYYIESDLASASNYTFEDEYNIALRSDGADPSADALIWTIYLNSKGELLIEDPTYNIAYVCVRVGGESGSETELPAPFYDDAIAVSADAIQGTWDITGWIVKADGSFSAVEGQTFRFDGSTVGYYIGADLMSESAYYFEDQYNIGLRTVGASKDDAIGVIWTVYLNDKGQLLIEDPAYAIIYVCQLQAGTGNETGNETGGETGNETGGQTGNETGGETGNENGGQTDLPDPFYDDAIVVSADAIQGTWDITGWIVKADGSFSAVEGQSFQFDGSTVGYFIGADLISSSAYYFEDQYNIGLRAVGASKDDAISVVWTVYLNDKGQLLIEDPAYSIIYVCELQKESDESGENSNLPDPFYDDAIVVSADKIKGTWNITGWIVKADGSFSAVEGQTFQFDGSTLSYYIGADLISASAYYFEDEYNIGLRAVGASKEDAIGVIWTVYLNEKGQLLIEDPAYAIIYVCELTNG